MLRPRKALDHPNRSDGAMAMSSSSHRRELYAKWARLLDSILPPPDENRLVPVAEVPRAALPMVEGSLADVGVSPILAETRSLNGESRFRVLVTAHEAEVATQAVSGF
jgi:hypothetical protein